RLERTDSFDLPHIGIEAHEIAVLCFDVNVAIIIGIYCSEHAVAAADLSPVVVERPQTIVGCAWTAPDGVVLKAAVDVVRFAHIERDAVELPQGNVVESHPCARAVAGYPDSAVVTENEEVRVARIDPHRVMIDVDVARSVATECLAAVIG